MTDPYFHDDTVTLYHGDALAVLAELPGESVNAIVTSPPYFGLRDYGVTATDWPETTYTPMVGLPDVTVPAMTSPLGLEPSPQAYIAHLVAIFREARRVLAGDGVMWLNVGDSYASLGGNGRGAGSALQGRKHGPAQEVAGRGSRKPGTTVHAKNMLGIPWQLAFALQADGWILRSDTIWAKPNGMPESTKDRPSRKHEHVFLFAKSGRYWFDLDAIREPLAHPADRPQNSWARDTKEADVPRQSTRQHRKERPQTRRAHELFEAAGLTQQHLDAMRAVGMSDAGKARATQSGAGKNTAVAQSLAAEAKAALGGYYREFLYGGGRNPGDVWTIPTSPFPQAHYAVMAPRLAERLVTSGCKPGGVVLDPFSGAGTTGMVAGRHGRRYIGIDASTETLDLSLSTRLAQGALMDGAP